MATYAKTTVRLDGVARTRKFFVEPAPDSDFGPHIKIWQDDDASSRGRGIPTMQSCRDPEQEAERFGQDLLRDGYERVG
jgi:hypothetical protein